MLRIIKIDMSQIYRAEDRSVSMVSGLASEPVSELAGEKTGFRVQGSGYRVQGTGFRVQGSVRH